MEEINNLVGRQFSRLKVIKKATGKYYPKNDKSRRSYWICKCSCGNKKMVIVSGTNLRTGNTKSCGCYNIEVLKNRPPKKYERGDSSSKLYWAWNHMMQRCYKDYKNSMKDYKNRGIIVCEEWKDFLIFKKWSLLNGFDEKNKGLSLDRIDVNGNYEPSNCRWTDILVQANNKRNSIKITVRGVTKTISEWGRILNISPETLKRRIELGWSEDRILSKPIRTAWNKK